MALSVKTKRGEIARVMIVPNDSSWYVVAALPVAVQTALHVRAEVVGSQLAAGVMSNTNAYTIEGAFYRETGNITQVGSTSVVTSVEGSATLDVEFTVDTTAQEIRVRARQTSATDDSHLFTVLSWKAVWYDGTLP
jgi:hypothetical protein